VIPDGKRKGEKRMILIYEYGIPFDPMEGHDFVEDQILMAHRYYNKLIEIERAKRARIRAIQQAHPILGPLVTESDETHELFNDIIDRQKKAKSKDNRYPEVDPEEWEAAKEISAEVRLRLTAAKAAVKAELTPAYEAASQEAKDRKRLARANSKVYWGTYLITEAAAEAAVNAKPKSRPGKVPPPWHMCPAFRRWNGEGSLAVQIQKPKALTEVTVFGHDNQFRITPVDPYAWDKSTPRGLRCRLGRTTFTMRVGMKRGETASFRMVMHRPLPPGSRITWAKIIRRRVDDRLYRFRYFLQLTVETTLCVRHPGLDNADPVSIPVVAINCGWRALADGSLRVATWLGSDNRTGTLELGREEFRDRIERAESIRSRRDIDLDELKKAIEGFGEIFKSMEVECVEKWKSFSRFHGLYCDVLTEYAENPTEEKKELLELLTSWHHRDRYLMQYENGCRGGALRFRREKYRLFALELAKAYPVVCIESWDLRRIVEDEHRLKEPSAARVEGASSIARQITRNTSLREGCVVLKQGDKEVELATQRCHLCGYGAKKRERWDAAKELVHVCGGCGAEWNQDVNFCENILTTSRGDLVGAPQLLEPKIVIQLGRFQKRAAAKREREAAQADEQEE